METQRVTLAFFSPTGTTRAIAGGIADGLAAQHVEMVNVTSPEARSRRLVTTENELLLIAAPVYMGRIPALLSEWLHSIQASGAPAVCVVVYGNRAFENALLELKDVAMSRGCVPVAGAAFIGEHSFSSPELPTAHDRPDAEDMARARKFGQRVREKLQSVSSVAELAELQVPGERPYGGVTELWDVDFIEVSEACIQCGLCAEVCPVGAVDAADSARIDVEKCITCCACIKRCPNNARSIKPSPVYDAARRLNSLYRERKVPELFL